MEERACSRRRGVTGYCSIPSEQVSSSNGVQEIAKISLVIFAEIGSISFSRSPF